MNRLIIIAGPQAAGKSTVISHLAAALQSASGLFPTADAPVLFPMQESRQIIVHKHMLLGGIFMSVDHELEVVRCDLERMDLIMQRDRDHLLYLDECNVFTLAHAAAHGIEDMDDFWQLYLERLELLNAAVVFLDAEPAISWDRRYKRYIQRLVYFPQGEHVSILRQYSDYLENLRPRLLEVYHRLPFPKALVDGTRSLSTVVSSVAEIIADFSRITAVTRVNNKANLPQDGKG